MKIQVAKQLILAICLIKREENNMHTLDLSRDVFVQIMFFVMVMVRVNDTFNMAIEYELGKKIEVVFQDVLKEHGKMTDEKLSLLLSEKISEIDSSYYTNIKLISLVLIGLILLYSTSNIMLYSILIIVIIGLIVDVIDFFDNMIQLS